MNEITSIKKIKTSLEICSDIFLYPEKIELKDIQYLDKIFKKSFLLKENFSKENFESEHIRLFTYQSSKLKTVPYASWWFEGNFLLNESYKEILNFYKKCGYKIDKNIIKVPEDHIGLMLMFIVLLIEEGKDNEIKEFLSKYFSFLKKFKESLKKNSNIKIYFLIVTIIEEIFNLLKNK